MKYESIILIKKYKNNLIISNVTKKLKICEILFLNINKIIKQY